MSKRQHTSVFVVVEVWRGMAEGARCFATLRAARKCYRDLIRGRNLMEDDVKIFPAQIESQVSSS